MLNRSALPVKAIAWWLRLTVGPLLLWTALLTWEVLLLMIPIKLIQTRAFVMCPSALHKLCSLSNWLEVERVDEAGAGWESFPWGAMLPQEGLSLALASLLFLLLFLSFAYLLCLRSALLNKLYSSKGELLSVLIVGSHWLVVGSYQLVSDPGNVFTTWSDFKIVFQL